MESWSDRRDIVEHYRYQLQLGYVPKVCMVLLQCLMCMVEQTVGGNRDFFQRRNPDRSPGNADKGNRDACSF